MKRATLISTISILAVYVILTQVIAPWWVKHRLPKELRSSCPTCELKIASASVSLLNPSHVTLQQVHLTQGQRGVADIEATVASIELDVTLTALMQKRFLVESLLIQNPDVMYTDGELPRPPKQAKTQQETSDWAVELKQGNVEAGKFTYRRVLHGKASLLTLHKIQLQGNLNPDVKVSSQFQLEKSGEILLDLRFPLRPGPLQAVVDVKIKDQNLADLNVFFETNDGVILKGRMLEGRGLVKVDGDKLRARVKAIYRDFNARLIKNKDQGVAEVFFTNLGIALTTKKKNSSPQKEEVQTIRKPDESVVHFILTGLKEAALAVASSN